MSMTLDRNQPFGTIYGAGVARYEQNGFMFDGGGRLIVEPTLEQAATTAEIAADSVHVTDDVLSAKAFLENILSGGSIAKAVIYQEAEKNNQNWDRVKEAMAIMNISQYKYRGVEMWRVVKA